MYQTEVGFCRMAYDGERRIEMGLGLAGGGRSFCRYEGLGLSLSGSIPEGIGRSEGIGFFLSMP
jgi:hypothetical protein